MGETERVKVISETGQESQGENECSGQSQTLGQDENDLGREKGQKVQIIPIPGDNRCDGWGGAAAPPAETNELASRNG